MKIKFLEDVDNVKSTLLYFLYSIESGKFSIPNDFLIEFNECKCIIEDTVIIENDYEAYCIKVLNEALKDAYATGKVEEIKWDLEKHTGVLHIDALF